jgi:hypothetical protein
MLMQTGFLPAELKGGIAMIYTISSSLVAGFISSYIAGLAFLPQPAWQFQRKRRQWHDDVPSVSAEPLPD